MSVLDSLLSTKNEKKKDVLILDPLYYFKIEAKKNSVDNLSKFKETPKNTLPKTPQNPHVIKKRPEQKIPKNSATTEKKNINLQPKSTANLDHVQPAKQKIPKFEPYAKKETVETQKKTAPKVQVKKIVKTPKTKIIADNNASNTTKNVEDNASKIDENSTVGNATNTVSNVIDSAANSASDAVENLGSQISDLTIPEISSATSIISPIKTEESSGSTFDFIKSIIPDSWINYIGSIPLIGGFLKSFFTKDEKKEPSTPAQQPAQTETATNSRSDNKSTKDLLDKEYAQMPENLKNITIEDSATPEKVVEQLAPLAMHIERKYGINAQFAITQMIIESGWKGGKYKDNKCGVFNIITGSWTGDTQKRMDGGENKEQEFRAYDNIAQAFIGYGIFMSSNEKYKGIVEKSAEESIEAIANSSYASDKNYKTKLIEVLKSVQNRWPKNIAPPTPTISTTVEKKTSSESFSHEEALDFLKNDFKIYSSSGEVNATRNEGTTSLEGMKKTTVKGMLNFKKFLEVKKITTGNLTITGGTENGHSKTLKYTHGNGYKFDLRYQDKLENYDWTSVGGLKKQTGSFKYYELTNNGFTYQIHPEGDHLDVGVVT